MYAVPNALWGDSVSSSNHIITTRGSDILIDYAETFHSPKSLKEKFSFWIMRRRIGSSLNNATFITSTSLKQKREIEKIVYNKEKLHLIRTGVDRSAFRINESGFKKEDKFVIFSPRSMKPIYNIELLIRGVATFVENSRNSNLDVELRIIDDVPGSSYSKRVRNLIKNENFDTFTKVLPKLSLNEMKENYGECNLVVMIPKSDGTPVSAIEAMLLKKPLLMGALDYDDDLFNEKTVWQIKDFTEKSIRNEIIEINEHRNIQENKVENAFQLALENASLQNSLSKIENLYINSTSNANSFKFNK